MKSLLLLSLFFLFQNQLPYKPKEEFEVKLDYQFKQRPSGDNSSIHLDETRKDFERRTSSATLPYLILNIKMLSAAQGKKVRITSNLTSNVGTKKIQDGTIIPLDLGFTDDVKDRVTAHEYTLTFVSAERKDLNRIIILVEENGNFMVNGETRGRF